MDRRQKELAKPYLSFNELLSKRRMTKSPFKKSLVPQILAAPTFYAHFDTKEALLEALCEDLFYI